ncbi:RIP metalloprotease RseP [Altererythrobacter sp. C41]|uniref:RIP metalloprotease RseP n=1 Tax=Altererythrobacter sp. C41 TaxID=2806021 RepID=UPI001EE40D61|nr:RIP metalloprotease RseP [Altererythrobacter sp. C41]
MADSPSFWMYIVGFLLVLGPLITIHEFGHYLVGRLFGVQAEAFSVGFGKELAGWTDRRGTRWKLSALPLGGYVQFKGDMNPASIPDPEKIAAIPEDERAGSFHFKPLWQRALIVFAGPATNILVALAIFAAFFMVVGNPVPVETDRQLTVAEFSEGSAAKEAGFEVGDRIVSIDGERMNDFRDIQDAVMLYPGRTFQIVVDRDGQRLPIRVTADSHQVTDGFGNTSKIGLLGIRPAQAEFEFERQGPIAATAMAVDHSIGIAHMMVTGVKQIVSGDRSVRELGGPIKIAKYSGEQLSLGPLAFINFIALISLNLAFINLLPIPALDGGHLAFYAAEAVRRKPVGPRGQELAFRTGVAVVLALMVFVTINDLVSLPIFGS